jgi:hypothetical protein
MINCQKIILKICLTFITLFTSLSVSNAYTPLQESLMIADSLFQEKSYTQAFEVYDEILRRGGQSSPAMLLKMAYIKEGLADYSQALYFLNLYYDRTANKRVLKKMENLAEKHALVGYEYDDAEFFLNLYQRFHTQILMVLLAIAVLLLSLIVYLRTKNANRPVAHVVWLLLLLVLILAVNNLGTKKPKAIIAHDDTYLMSGPSAGAEVVDVVKGGHRVSIKNREDVWLQIDWNGKDVYVKQNAVMPLNSHS